MAVAESWQDFPTPRQEWWEAVTDWLTFGLVVAVLLGLYVGLVASVIGIVYVVAKAAGY